MMMGNHRFILFGRFFIDGGIVIINLRYVSRSGIKGKYML
jgi:hypothetical protein